MARRVGGPFFSWEGVACQVPGVECRVSGAGCRNECNENRCDLSGREGGHAPALRRESVNIKIEESANQGRWIVLIKEERGHALLPYLRDRNGSHHIQLYLTPVTPHPTPV
jgi:hypothetical protein